MLQRSKNNVLMIVLLLPALVMAGILTSMLIALPRLRYVEIRLVYGVFTLIALGLIVLQIQRWKTDGFFSPLTMAMLGMIYFFSLTPLIKAEYFYVYSRAALFLSLVLTVFVGMISFTVGFFLAPAIRWKPLGKWLSAPVSAGKMSTIVMILFVGYIALTNFVSVSGGFTFTELITQNVYLLGNKENLIEKFTGLSYYGFLIMRQLPIALAVPSIFCVTARRMPKWKSAVILAGLFLGILISVSSGGRSILSYIVGGMGVFLVIRNVKIVNPLSRKNLWYLTVFSGITLALFLITSLQIQFRSEGSKLGASLDPAKVVQGIQKNVVHEVTDQNFTLYRVVMADQQGTLQYLWGESYALAFVAFVPRSIWPDKPGGADMYNKLAIVNPWNANQNISHSFLGELIYNFSGWSIIPGSLFFGLWAGAWWRIFQRYRQAQRMQILYAMSVIPVAFMVRGTFNAMFGSLFYPMLFTILVLVLAKAHLPGMRPPDPEASLEDYRER